MLDLEKYKVQGIPERIYCISDFVSETEEQFTLKKIHEAPKIKWTNLLNRRLQNWGGLPKEKGMIAEEIPFWLQCHIDKIHQLDIFGPEHKPNHVLVNEYKPGQGISPHLDGSLFYPTIATVSLGSHTVLNFYEPLTEDEKLGTEPCTSLQSRLKFQLYVPPRSLILIQDEMFHHYLHGIEEIEKDCDINLIFPPQFSSQNVNLQRDTRVSLTIRHVPNTKKIKIRL